MAQDTQLEQRALRRAAHWTVPFFTIWIGQALSLVGSGLGGFALVWWLTATTGSATVLATAGLVQVLPGVILGPFVGALVDRWNRRVVMMVADAAIALFSAWLAWLFWAGTLQIWHVYAIMFVRAVGGTFHWPAMQASTSLMVPKDQLSRVAGMNQMLEGILNVISPPLGALLMAVLPLHAIMAIDVTTAAFAIAPLLFVPVPQPERRQAANGEREARPSIWEDVKAGFLYIWHWRGLSIILLLATLLNFLVNPGFSLVPILVVKHFGGGVTQLAWMNSAWGLGAVAGGLALSVWGGFRLKIRTSLLGMLGMSVGILIVGFVPSTLFELGVLGMFLAGFMNPITNGPFFALLQDVVAPDMQGRVFTVIASTCAAASPLGMAIAGPVADRLGVQIWFVTGGIAGLLMGLGMASIPAVMGLEDRQPAAEVRPEGAPIAEPVGE
jgi:DHA3 family macrolide efflux protein-like MFS transporter